MESSDNHPVKRPNHPISPLGPARVNHPAIIQ
jgi:hypothetical protein